MTLQKRDGVIFMLATVGKPKDRVEDIVRVNLVQMLEAIYGEGWKEIISRQVVAGDCRVYDRLSAIECLLDIKLLIE